MFSIDALRPDHLGAYGYDRATSPEIDRLAADGAVFESAYSQATWTLPSVASLFLSQYVSTHQIEHPKLRVPESATTLAESLRAAGINTAAFVMGAYTAADFGMDQGFDEFQSHSGNIEEKNGRLMAWLEKVEGPFFAYIHYVDVHHPYNEPNPRGESFGTGYDGPVDGKRPLGKVRPLLDPPGLQHLIDLYDGGIRYTDLHFGALLRRLEELGLRETTWIIVTADHGEAFLEHREMLGHRGWPYEELIRVPLIVSGPGIAAGTRFAQPVEAVDLAPTVLEGFGLEAGETMQGESLFSLLRGVADREDPMDQLVLSETLPMSVKTIRSGEWKLMHNFATGESELYDLSRDPYERFDRAEEEPGRVEDLLAQLSRRVAANFQFRGAGQPEETDWEGETRRQLKALGYIQ